MINLKDTSVALQKCVQVFGHILECASVCYHIIFFFFSQRRCFLCWRSLLPRVPALTVHLPGLSLREGMHLKRVSHNFTLLSNNQQLSKKCPVCCFLWKEFSTFFLKPHLCCYEGMEPALQSVSPWVFLGSASATLVFAMLCIQGYR